MKAERLQKESLTEGVQVESACNLSDCSCFSTTSIELKIKKKCCKKYKKKGKNCKKCPRLMMN